jgi:nucleoid DNA-binding protein
LTDIYKSKVNREQLNPTELLQQVNHITGYSKKKIKEILRATAWVIWQETVKGKRCTIPNLCSFTVNREGVRNSAYSTEEPLIVRVSPQQNYRQYVKQKGRGVNMELTEEEEGNDDDSDEV